MEVELARGDLSAVGQALQDFEQLEAYQGYAHHWRYLPVIRARWWLAQGQMKEASDWATGFIFPEEAWEGPLYSAFSVVIRVYFAQRRWAAALELLDRFRGHLDRPGNIAVTITYLAQLLVALHHTDQSEQVRGVAARLFALTEPEGHLRVYLDEGEPMRQALQALLTPHSQQHEFTASTRAYVAKLLAAFKQEEQGVSTSLGVTPPLQPGFSPTRQTSVVSSAPLEPLTQREQEVLRLLAEGASNQQIAAALVIELSTAKKHVSNLLSKLGAESRTQAITRARTLSLL
jgi:LuxR family maltose regulon positive regulatory protein